MSSISIIIPAFNEEGRIRDVIGPLIGRYNVVVVDDNSSDDTAKIASELGAEVLQNKKNEGYIDSIKKGFRFADSDILVTMDADGEHRPEDVGKIVEPIIKGNKDLVFGVREHIPRISERFLNFLTNLEVEINDSGTGFRALKKDLAKDLELNTSCTCGTLVLEANKKGAKIGEVPIKVQEIDKPKKIAWNHFIQFFYVLKFLLK